MKHLLFICSSAIDRSPVAAELFENNRKYEAKYAGLNSWARIPLTKAAVDWADIIFVMDERNQKHRTQLLERFPDAIKKEIVVLDIDNSYVRYDLRLIELLRAKLEDWLAN